LSDDSLAAWQATVLDAILSDSITVCVSAFGVAREMMQRGLLFPISVLERAIEILPLEPSGRAAKLLEAVLRFQKDDAVVSLPSIFASLVSAAQSSEFCCDNCLGILAELVPVSGFTDGFLKMLDALIASYTRDSAYAGGVMRCVAVVFALGGTTAAGLLSKLVQCMEENEAWLTATNEVASAVFVLVVVNPDLLSHAGLGARVIAVIGWMLAEGGGEDPLSDLLAAVIQLKLPEAHALAGDISGIAFQNPLNEWQVLASLVVTGSVVIDRERLDGLITFLHGELPCLYEKRLFAAVLLLTAEELEGVADQIVPIAARLLAAEQKQRKTLGNCVRTFPCSHNLPFPIEGVDLSGLFYAAIQTCSDNIKREVAGIMHEFIWRSAIPCDEG
jgi:hypothetical protein